jgi:hypothetical protein
MGIRFKPGTCVKYPVSDHTDLAEVMGAHQRIDYAQIITGQFRALRDDENPLRDVFYMLKDSRVGTLTESNTPVIDRRVIKNSRGVLFFPEYVLEPL